MAKEFKSIGEKAAARFMGSSTVNASDSKEIEPIEETEKLTNVTDIKKRKYELRDERVSLRIKPSMKENLEKLSVMEGKSINNLIENILEGYIRINKASIIAFDEEMKLINGQEE